MSDSVEGLTQAAGGGALLRQAREARGIHVAALAVALKVSVRQLEALEQDRLDLLPDLTFARALAGSVCRHLKIDPASILAHLPASVIANVTVPERINEPFHASDLSGGESGWSKLQRPSVLFAAALMVAALALVFLPWSEQPNAPAASAPEVAAPVSGGADKLVTETVNPSLPLPAASAPDSLPQAAASNAAK